MKTRAEIFSPRVVEPVLIATDELGEGYIKRFGALDNLAWEDFKGGVIGTDGKPSHLPTYHAKLVQLSYCDEKGELIFDINDIQKIIQNLKQSTIAQIFIESCRINCLTRYDTEVEVAKARANFQAEKAAKEAALKKAEAEQKKDGEQLPITSVSTT